MGRKNALGSIFYVFRAKMKRKKLCITTDFLLRKCNFSPWEAVYREIMTAKNDIFSKKFRAIHKKKFNKSAKSHLCELHGGISSKNVVFGLKILFFGILSQNTDFGHFWGIFLVKNSIFTIPRYESGKGNRHHHVTITPGILKRYHTSPNSQYFPF